MSSVVGGQRRTAAHSLARPIETWNFEDALAGCDTGEALVTRHVYDGLEVVEEYAGCGEKTVQGYTAPASWALAREFLWGARFPEPLVLIDWTAAGDVGNAHIA